MQLYTSQMALHKRAKKEGIPFLDITVKTGDATFAPTWEMVTGYKNGTLSETEYALQYRDIMRDSANKHMERWNEVCDMDVVILGCYCLAGEFCHRHLLAEYLSAYCRGRGVPFIHCGEYGK